MALIFYSFMYMKTTETIRKWISESTVSLIFLGVALILFAGCSVKRTAVNIIGDALAGGGGVYTSDDDPELIREAIPFGLKTYESLLAVSPEHLGLLQAAAIGSSAMRFKSSVAAERAPAHEAPAQ